MLRKLTLVLCFVCAAVVLYAQEKEQGRLGNCGVVLEEIMNTPENIPQEVMKKAECVIVFPSVMKFAVGFGGSYGRGAMVCRTGKNFSGP
jgi:lipid-binding SYLF domain-containing protein